MECLHKILIGKTFKLGDIVVNKPLWKSTYKTLCLQRGWWLFKQDRLINHTFSCLEFTLPDNWDSDYLTVGNTFGDLNIGKTTYTDTYVLLVENNTVFLRYHKIRK